MSTERTRPGNPPPTATTPPSGLEFPQTKEQFIEGLRNHGVNNLEELADVLYGETGGFSKTGGDWIDWWQFLMCPPTSPLPGIHENPPYPVLQ